MLDRKGVTSPVLKFAQGEIALGYSGRAWDEVGHDLVACETCQGSTFYGEWERRWASNGDDYDVEILSYGFATLFIAGSPNPEDRVVFGQPEADDIRTLIEHLFRDKEITDRCIRGRFLGGIHFVSGWIRTR